MSKCRFRVRPGFNGGVLGTNAFHAHWQSPRQQRSPKSAVSHFSSTAVSRSSSHLGNRSLAAAHLSLPLHLSTIEIETIPNSPSSNHGRVKYLTLSVLLCTRAHTYRCMCLYNTVEIVVGTARESVGVWRIQKARGNGSERSTRGKLGRRSWCSDIDIQNTACVFLPFVVLHKPFQKKKNRR